MKVIAMYLPQFHRVKENDEWWGEGFTEWTTLKQAQPLFEGHDQPRKPLNDNYYDLLDKKTMLWQVMLMKKYGVFGMCFYHYWFKDGKRILEKPAENLLTWKDVDMPFCFSWANESWMRTWSAIGEANTWSTKFENEHLNDDKEVLLAQSYGGENDWKQHFDYLLPFFKDERYIKIDEKPVFVIYKPLKIFCIERMRDYWNRLARENGFQGIYFIATNVTQKGACDAILIQEPQMSFGTAESVVNERGLRIYDARHLWDNILQCCIGKKDIIFGGTPGYDDTPRHENAGRVICDMSPDLFCDGMKQLMLKSEMHGNDIVFINAWNEWGEGMYLEPDERNGYKYLEAVKEAVETYRTETPRYNYRKSITFDKEIERLSRYESYWRLLDNWMTVIDAGSNIGEYFNKNGVKTIAVYGMGMMGKHLIAQLKDCNVKIVYGIDRKTIVNSKKYGFPVVKVSDHLEKVDAIVVAVTYDLHSIYTLLSEKMDCPILFLGEIIDDLLIGTKDS